MLMPPFDHVILLMLNEGCVRYPHLTALLAALIPASVAMPLSRSISPTLLPRSVARSANSFPSTPMWLHTHEMKMFLVSSWSMSLILTSMLDLSRCPLARLT